MLIVETGLTMTNANTLSHLTSVSVPHSARPNKLIIFSSTFFHIFQAKHKDIITLLFLFLTPDDKNSLMRENNFKNIKNTKKQFQLTKSVHCKNTKGI